MGRIADEISRMAPLEIIFRAVFGSVGLLVLGFAAWHGFDTARTVATYEKVRAEVVSSHADGSPNARFKTYGLEVKWRTEDGGIQRASVDRAQQKYEPGEQVDVYYRPETAYRARAGGLWDLWTVPVFVAVIGGMLFGVGVWPAKDEKRKRRK
jgi:uncharacterized membrane protein YedE/YeeE